MTERKDDGSYYAKAGIVWKSPVVTKIPGGGSSISIGFQVCVMTEVVGDDAAEAIAELMNRGDKLPEAVRLLDALLGLEKGSGQAALAFVEGYKASVGGKASD